jgi:hypothetical protein
MEPMADRRNEVGVKFTAVSDNSMPRGDMVKCPHVGGSLLRTTTLFSGVGLGLGRAFAVEFARGRTRDDLSSRSEFRAY